VLKWGLTAEPHDVVDDTSAHRSFLYPSRTSTHVRTLQTIVPIHLPAAIATMKQRFSSLDVKVGQTPLPPSLAPKPHFNPNTHNPFRSSPTSSQQPSSPSASPTSTTSPPASSSSNSPNPSAASNSSSTPVSARTCPLSREPQQPLPRLSSPACASSCERAG